jgi:peptidoglycan/LPS O-acetylase OafA/YrhL
MRIQHVDGLRGIAIIWVVLYHSYSRWPQKLDFISVTQQIPFFKYGYLGVPLFFMISGFVIFMTLDKSRSLIHFITKRWLRLFPAMLIATILVYSSSSFFHERPAGNPSIIDTVPGLLFISPELIHYLSGIHIYSLEGAFWSLYVEVVFYFFIGIIYFKFGRDYCIPALFLALMLSYISFALSKIGISTPYELTTMLGFVHFSWFIIGCVTYEYIQKNTNKTLYIIFIISVILSILRTLYIDELSVILFLFSSSTILLFLSSFFSQKVKYLISNKFLLAFGFISYPLYLIHENALISILVKLERLYLPEYILIASPIFVITLLYIVSFIIAKYLEPKLRSVIEKARQ